MKKLLAVLLSLLMLMSLVACGGDKEPTQDPADKPADTTPTPVGDADIVTPLWQLAYDETVWVLDEENLFDDDDYCSATLQIPDPEDPEYYLVNVDIWVSVDDPYDFREDLVDFGFDQYEYAVNNAYDLVSVGGVECLRHEWESWGETTVQYFNRVEGAGATVEVSITAADITDSRADELLKGLTFTLTDTGNEDGPWEWEGEAFAADVNSATAGAVTVTAEWIPIEEYISTFETFDHAVAAVGNTVYLLTEGVLKQYDYNGSELTFVKDVDLPADDFDTISATDDGSLWLSGTMNDLTVIKDGVVTATYEDLDDVVMHHSGTWGVSYFAASDAKLVTFAGGSYTAKDLTFPEVSSIMNLVVGEDEFYVCGSDANDENHKVFVYNKDGVYQRMLGGEDGDGLGSITYVTKSDKGYIGFDGNMREVIVWGLDGSYIGAMDSDELFENDYPWFCASTMMSDGSILTVMTAEREDRSATELVAFNVTGF